MVSAPLLYTQGKCGGDGEVTRQGQTSLGRQSQAQGPLTLPSTSRLSSPALLLWPKPQACREDVDRLCPPQGHDSPPRPCQPPGGWLCLPRQRTGGLWTPLPTGGSQALLCSHSVFNRAVSAKSRKRQLPSRTLRSWDVSPWLLPPDHRHKCCCLHGGSLDLAFPRHLNPHSFWGGQGWAWVGREDKNAYEFILSRGFAWWALCAQQSP